VNPDFILASTLQPPVTVSAPSATAITDVLGTMTHLEHEQVMYCSDPELGLKAIIAVHNTVLGPALGGLRFWNYTHESEAVFDVLRLSRGMTFKSAAAGLHLGGGKAVLIGDARKLRSEAYFRRFGKFVENLAGKYITAEDVGVNEHDMTWIRRETRHVTGLPKYMGGSGDPSPVTAYGVYMGLKAALKVQTGSESVAGKGVVIQGVGKVGGYLAGYLAKEGAKLYIADVNEDNLKRVAAETNATVIGTDDLFSTNAEVYAPCALGAGLNPDTIPQLKFSVVAGGANNQLLDEARDGQALVDRGILYAPDFLINAGGVMNVYSELLGYNEAAVMQQAEGIYQATIEVLKSAAEEGITPQAAAILRAKRRIAAIARIKQYI